MATREEIKARMQDENVRYLLVQFVDLNGSPKAKMVPSDHLDDVLDEGAGFAGAALPGTFAPPAPFKRACRQRPMQTTPFSSS